MTRLLPLLALAFALLPPAQAQSNDSLVVLWVFEARIMFETVVGDRPAEAIWKAPAGSPAAESIAFGRGRRFSSPIGLSLTDSLFVGSGRVPGVTEIRAIRVVTESGRLTVRFPQAGWDEGVAAARIRFEPREGAPVTGEGHVYIQEIPSGAQFNIGMPPTLAATIGIPPAQD